MKIKRRRQVNLPIPTTRLKIRKKKFKKSFTVKHLEAMANDALRRKYPYMPPDWLAPRKYRDNGANGLTISIIDFVKLEGHQVERFANMEHLIDWCRTFTDVTGRTRTIGQMKWILGTDPNSIANISATIAGLSVKIEFKHGRDQHSKAQLKYQQTNEQASGIYLITRTFEQFYNRYNQIFKYNG